MSVHPFDASEAFLENSSREEECVPLEELPESIRAILFGSNIVNGDQVDVGKFKKVFEAMNDMSSGSLPLSSFPAEVKAILSPHDVEGNGVLSKEELKNAFGALDLQNQGRIRISNYPQPMKEIIKELDTDGDEIITAHEVMLGVESLLRERQKSKIQLQILLAMSIFLILFTGIACATMFAMFQITKESLINNKGTMLAKTTNLPVLTASAEMMVTNGVLSTRCATDSCPANFSSIPVLTSQVLHPLNLSSQVDDEIFLELKSVTITQGLSFINFQVMAVARYSEDKSRYGSVVVIFTHLGEITLDGQDLMFHESLRGAFSRAGFAVDHSSGRRLIGVVEILGFFNRINKLREGAGNTGPPQEMPSSMPLTFTANTSELHRCGQRDCWLDGRMVDWVSPQDDGSFAMVTRQQIYSLTFDDLPYTKTVVTKEQWVDQTLVSLQNVSHKLTFQTFKGVNYHCLLQNDTSLADSLSARRRRAASLESPFQFMGYKTVGGVYCKHFRLSNASDSEIFEDYYQRRVYQLRWQSLTLQFDDLRAVEGEKSNPIARDDLNMQEVMAACDPLDRIAPPQLVEGYLSNRILPQPSWGSILNDTFANISSTSLKYDNGTFALPFLPPIGMVNDSLRGHIEDSKGESMKSWNGEVVHLNEAEFEYFRHQHRRELELLDITQEDPSQVLSLKFPPMDISPKLKSGSLFNVDVYRVKDRRTNKILAEYIIVSSHSEVACITKLGELHLYIPYAGNPRPIGVLGQITIEMDVICSLAGFIGETLTSILSKFVNIKLGAKFGGKGAELKQASCPSCAGFQTNNKENFCWLKNQNAYYQSPAQSGDRIAYKNNPWPWRFYQMNNRPGNDLTVITSSTSDQCMKQCTQRSDCGGVVMSNSALTQGRGRCILKSLSAFQGSSGVQSSDFFTLERIFIGSGFEQQQPGYAANSNFPGSDLQVMQGSKVECMTVCSNTPFCYGIVMDQLSYDGFSNGSCRIKTSSAFKSSNQVNALGYHAMNMKRYSSKRNSDFPNNDIMGVSTSSGDCEYRCESFNDVLAKQRTGSFPVNPRLFGQGYVEASILNIRFKLDLSFDILLGVRCAANQPNGDAEKLGFSLTAGYRIVIDFWIWSLSQSERMNLYPSGTSDACSGDSSVFVTADNPAAFYKLATLTGITCSK